MNVIWTQEAMERLEDIHHYLSEQEKAPQAARETLTRILSREYQMRSMPQSGRVVPGYNIPNLRELLEGSYRIIYFVHDTHVLVVSVMHQSRILSKVRALNTAVNEMAKAQQKKPTENIVPAFILLLLHLASVFLLKCTE